MTGSPWDQAGDDFSGVAERIRSAMNEGRDRYLAERRQMGLNAYIAAHEARGGARPVGRGAIVNSFAAMLGLEAREL